mmetsp:Transcript_39106/g.91686  ORF Transcript_39106/g.91686 Transcript_39106/m.91686 type:complete len:87 (+) Transcript_39106:196-456(+)
MPRLINVTGGLQQAACNTQVTRLCRKTEWRHSVSVVHVNVCTMLAEYLDSVQVTYACCQEELSVEALTALLAAASCTGCNQSKSNL